MALLQVRARRTSCSASPLKTTVHEQNSPCPKSPGETPRGRSKTVSESSPPTREKRDEGRTTVTVDPGPDFIEHERRRLAETKAQIEEDTELLGLLRSYRLNLRRSVSPEKQPEPPARPPSPSAARKACNEAYARMTPLQQHLLRWDGIRPTSRDVRRERREWEEYKNSRRPGPAQEDDSARDRDRRRRMEELRDEATRLEALWRKRERREMAAAWEAYEARWTWLASRAAVRFRELPWPVPCVFLRKQTAADAETLSSDAISAFVFSAVHSAGRTRKQRLHEALRRYHPDRFEGGLLGRMPERGGERERAREAAGGVVRVLGRLLEEEG